MAEQQNNPENPARQSLEGKSCLIKTETYKLMSVPKRRPLFMNRHMIICYKGAKVSVYKFLNIDK